MSAFIAGEHQHNFISWERLLYRGIYAHLTRDLHETLLTRIKLCYKELFKHYHTKWHVACSRIKFELDDDGVLEMIMSPMSMLHFTFTLTY